MYNSSSDALPFASGKKLRSFFELEINTYLQEHNCSDFNQESLKELITLLHNGVVPSDTTMSLFFKDGNTTVDPPTVLDLLFTTLEDVTNYRVPIPDVKIKPNAIFPEAQTKIIPFKAPDLSTVRYNDNDFVSYKQGYIKKAQKSLFGMTYSVRYGILTKDVFTIYEKDTRDKIAAEIDLQNITEIEICEEDRGVYPFIIHQEEGDVMLGCEDDSSRKDWIKRLASLLVLRMTSSNSIYTDEDFKKWIVIGANVNACFGKEDARPILYYLLKYKKHSLANWLVSIGASPNCILRWQFVVIEKVLSPIEILTFMESNNISLCLKSDDGFNYNIMYYMCYFGNVDGVNRLMESNDYQSLLNDPTESNDIALTITLLSPLTTEDTKVMIASRIYTASNLSICNKSSQNPLQLLLLMGKMNLLFKLLPLSINVREDQFHNSMLHLAIKAGLTSVSRYILRYNNFGDINQLDNANDSVLSLAIKSGDESLACEIVREGGDSSICSPSWKMDKSDKDLAIHQALKRNMSTLSNLIMDKRNYFMVPDTEGNLPIHLSFIHHIPACIEYMLNCSEVLSFLNSPNAHDYYSPLHLAILYGYYDQALQLLSLGADVNAENNMGFTPCHILVKYARGDYDTIKINTLSPEHINQLCSELLNHNPDLTKLCKEQSETCLHMAIRSGIATEDLALLFLQYDSNLVTIRDFEQCTPLIRAVEIRNYRLVQALCDYNAELDVVNVSHDTPLHIAVKNGDVGIVEYLVNNGAYLRVWNREGVYPMHIAIQQGNYDILTMLCPYQIDANLPTRDGQTPFILACLNGDIQCADFLLQQAADPYILDHNDQSCLNIIAAAIRKNPTDMRYAHIAQMVLSLSEVFARECFSVASTISDDVNTIQDYVDEAIEKKILMETEEVAAMPRMSVAPTYDNYQEMNGSSQPPSFPGSGESPIDPVNKYPTLKSEGTEENQDMNTMQENQDMNIMQENQENQENQDMNTMVENPVMMEDSEKIMLLEQREAYLTEIERLEAALRNVEEEELKEQQQEEAGFSAKFMNWCQRKESQEKMRKMVEKMKSQGFPEDKATLTCTQLFESRLRDNYVSKIKEKYNKKKQLIQSNLENKRSELEMIEEKLN